VQQGYWELLRPAMYPEFRVARGQRDYGVPRPATQSPIFVTPEPGPGIAHIGLLHRAFPY